MEIPKIIPSILAYLVMAGIIPILIVCFRLQQLLSLNKLRGNVVLRERFLVSFRDIIVVIIYSIVFLNNGLEEPPLGIPLTQVLTRSIMLLLPIFAIYWLWIYRDT